MFRYFLFFSVFLTSVIFCDAQKNGPFSLVSEGKSKTSILIGPNSTSYDKTAAEMLRKYIDRISGCNLPVISLPGASAKSFILIGPADAATKQQKGLKEDGFILQNNGKNIVIQSGGHKGSVYGVVELLERYMGCRMYAPSVEIVPHSKNILLPPFHILQNPVNTFRVVNGTFDRDSAYRDWQRLNSVNEVFATGYYVHTFNRLVPWEKYFESNPEYFSFMNGKRIRDQLCLSNPDVYRIAIEKLKQEMALQPGKKIWSVSQNDNFSYCQCEKCAKITRDEGSPAGPIIRFVNRVAAEFPDKIISTLAYQYSRKAPVLTKPAPNVQIMLCTIELNRSKPIAEDSTSRSFLRDITDWGKISKHIYLWDYTVDFAYSTTPFPNLHVLQPNIQFLTKCGASEHFQQSNTARGHELSELKGYLLAHLLWNPWVNADSVINDFLKGYFGQAAPFIGQYINRLTSEIKKTGEWLDIYGHPVTHASTFLSSENMAFYNKLFDNAENAVKNDSSILQRVKVYRLPIQFAAIEIGKNDMFGPRGFYTEKEGRFILHDGAKQSIEDFYTTCRKNEVAPLNESGLTAEEYYRSSLRFIDVQVAGNLAFRKTVESSPAPSPKYGKGDLAMLTNGVQGANDYKAHWLGWEASDFSLKLDLETVQEVKSISIGTLYDPKSWILHPVSVTCLISEDGTGFREIGKQAVEGDQRKEPVTRTFTFSPDKAKCRYIRFVINGTKSLPDWHPSAGGDSWVFVDEIVVR